MGAHVSVSRWSVARITVPCHHCGAVIGAGEPVRLVGPRALVFCVKCTRHRFLLDPPTDMPAAPVSRHGFAKPSQLRAEFDARMRQTGEDQ